MARLVRSTTVHARAEDIFDFLEDKTHIPEFWPSMMEVSNIETLPNGGKKYQWAYKMAGLRIDGDSEEIEVVPNKKLVAKNRKGIEGSVTWLLNEHGTNTDVTLEMDYEVPVPVLGKINERAVHQFNEHEVNTVIANLKTQIEI